MTAAAPTTAVRAHRRTGSAGCSTWCRTCWPGPGIAVAEAAADLGVTERQLREDLELLWVCGLPGYGPGDLIDMAFDGDRVTITYDAGIDRPLRLTPDEALALVVALRMLAETPGTGTRDAIERALAKIENAAGDLAGAPVAVRLPADAERLDAIRGAVERGHALRLTYYTATRDETTDRVVDPMRVLMVGGTGYLEAWCRRAEATRMFRVDRIDAFTELDEPAAPPARGSAAATSAAASSTPRPTCRWSRCGWAGAAGGSPSTTRCEEVRQGRRGVGGRACGSPTWAGRSGCCSASARTSPWSARRSWSTGSAPRPTPRWTSTLRRRGRLSHRTLGWRPW